MARGDRKKGREDKKPKQPGAKPDGKSAYQQDRNQAAAATPFKVMKKK